MYTVITVVFTTKKLNAYEISQKKHYAYVCNDSVKVGDIITGHCGDKTYDTPMQVIDIHQTSSRNVYNVDGDQIALKNLNVDSINGDLPFNQTKTTTIKNNQEMKKASSMFAGIADKYKSQWIPEREDGVKMSMDGTMCIAIGDEYIGMKSDGTLTSYPREVLIDVPVYSINKPSAQVQIGDVIKNGNGYGKVMMKNADGSLKILSYTGYTHNKQEVQDFLLGQAMTRVLVNMFNFDANGFNPLFFALGDENSDFDIKDLIMLQMMTGNKNPLGNMNGMNPFMLMALTDKGEGQNNDMMNLMLMSSMMGGQNPFGNVVPPATTPATPEQTLTPGFDVSAFVDNIKKNPELAKALKDALNAE